MIIFKKVRAKNFLSVGNNFLEYDLNKEHLSAIKGVNGCGKCVNSSSKIQLHNTITGEVIDTTIGEFYERQRENRTKH